jgi:carboxymethylenebutenolidase
MSDAIQAETVRITGHEGDEIEAYLAQPLVTGAFGGVVVIHHFPGYDEETKEITRRFADHGYLALCPNLYSRQAPGATPEDAAVIVRGQGGIPDEQLVGDVDGAARYLKAMGSSNAKVGTIGYCSGGRQSFLAACSLTLDAAVDCYGAFVVVEPPEGSPLKVGPVAPLAEHLSCPLLGLFGAEDQNPAPAETAELEAILSAHHKTFEFHTFEGAGHAFFATNRPNYRPEAAGEGWKKIWDFFGRTLSS